MRVRWLLLGIARRTADDYPNRPITVIVPYPAGGPTDAIIRNLGERMRVSLGQPVIVEYVTGAGGTVGTARAAKAAPDGYTIICGHVGTHVTNGAVYSAAVRSGEGLRADLAAAAQSVHDRRQQGRCRPTTCASSWPT